MLTVALPEAMRKGVEILFEDGLQYHDYCPLDDFILEAGFAYRPLLSPFLVNPYPLTRRRHITVATQPLVQIPELCFKVHPVLFRRHLVHTRRCILAGQTVSFAQKINVYQVVHVVEHHFRITRCLLRNSLESR
jgi:hypothetical protein